MAGIPSLFLARSSNTAASPALNGVELESSLTGSKGVVLGGHCEVL